MVAKTSTANRLSVGAIIGGSCNDPHAHGKGNPTQAGTSSEDVLSREIVTVGLCSQCLKDSDVHCAHRVPRYTPVP